MSPCPAMQQSFLVHFAPSKSDGTSMSESWKGVLNQNKLMYSHCMLLQFCIRKSNNCGNWQKRCLLQKPLRKSKNTNRNFHLNTAEGHLRQSCWWLFARRLVSWLSPWSAGQRVAQRFPYPMIMGFCSQPVKWQLETFRETYGNVGGDWTELNYLCLCYLCSCYVLS